VVFSEIGAESMKKCPRCGGESRRSHTHGFIQKRVLNPIGIRPFRCRDCGNHFYRFSRHAHHANSEDQTSNASIFNQAKNGNGHFKELIAEIRAKEGELGLVKQDNHMADELRRLHERAEQEGLNGTFAPVQQPLAAPQNGDSKPSENQKTPTRGKQRGSQPAPVAPELREIRPAEIFQKSQIS